MAKVEAPNKHYAGPGPGGAVFTDGVAEVEDEAALNYYRAAGYTVDGETENPHAAPEPPDPRDLTEVTVGTRLRDAAVDPEPEDFLAPTNAGQGNPHGSDVISPEIHASGPAGIRPGEVFAEDAGKQDKRETEFAQARLVEGKTAAEAAAVEVPDTSDRGDLDISDPGSAKQGRANATTDTQPDAETETKADAQVEDEAEAPAKPAAKRTAKKTATRRS
ncbi:hypothetical protein GUY44_18915 [Pimelobacter simplex]|uniref:Uncharacterized protein n=1 Tax=Nocardioides simplex TaxID=2045 RepID=A0A0A1DN38_NOCSI|nr:hypothetical protein [Pimelobacter simplex]AIY17997.1 hypothetical protein KR76_16745 [Pimelobacter simplex]MCG8152565.1 hypothetical protein [Pimelobacter simplex]GEB17059.1 hypothetical protein NSI01_53740 [Pimelobacter simplex]SFM76927.1 hypothetical protein SAMN05421671_3434 [Pimelobacter simplex]